MNLKKYENIRKCINPLFFFSLTLLIVLSFDIKINAYSDITELFSRFHHYILTFAIALGVMFVFLYRKKINNIIETDRINYTNDQIKGKAFPANHPKLNRLPIINILARFIFTHGWIYSFAFFSIIVFSFFFFRIISAAQIFIRMNTRWFQLQKAISVQGHFISGII